MAEWRAVHYRVLWELVSSLRDKSSPDDEFVFALAREALAKMVPLDACYIAFYDAKRQTIRFAFNYDSVKRFNDPLELSLGEGPTSWVIRNRQTLLFPGDKDDVHKSGMTWGTMALSASAIHSPIFAYDWNGERNIVGAISVQSYSEHAYDAAATRAVEAVAGCLGMLVERERAGEAHQALLALINGASTFPSSERETIRLRLEAILGTIQSAGEDIYTAMPPDDQRLMEALLHLRRTFFKAFTDMRQAFIPATTQQESQSSVDVSVFPNESLTRREVQILHLLPTSMTYQEIADSLMISINTVDFHIRNLFGKLGVSTRHEAAARAPLFLADKHRGDTDAGTSPRVTSKRNRKI